MSDKWAVNASPVILLAKVGRIDLLSRLVTNLVIPASVAQEVKNGPESDPGRVWVTGPPANARRCIIFSFAGHSASYWQRATVI